MHDIITYFYYRYKNMQYQLPNGKVIYLSIEQFLEMTDQDIQFLMSIDHGVHIVDPFTGSAVENTTYKEFDFSYLPNDENEENNVFDDISLDDIIDLEDPTDI